MKACGARALRRTRAWIPAFAGMKLEGLGMKLEGFVMGRAATSASGHNLEARSGPDAARRGLDLIRFARKDGFGDECQLIVGQVPAKLQGGKNLTRVEEKCQALGGRRASWSLTYEA